MAATEPLEEPDAGAPWATQPTVPDEPAGVQGLSAQGKPGAPVDLHLPRSHAQLPAELDDSTAVAEASSVRGPCRHAAETPGRHRQLLPDQGPDGSRGSRQREHPHAYQSRARLQKPASPAAQGQATGSQQPRTPRRPQNLESRVICTLCQILAQSGNVTYFIWFTISDVIKISHTVRSRPLPPQDTPKDAF